MSSLLRQKEISEQLAALPAVKDLRVGIVAAQWNSHITDKLLVSAIDTLKQYGCKDSNLHVWRVPGTVELTYGAQTLHRVYAVDAIIIIGCVIRGDTPHFDYVCQSVTQGCTEMNLRGNVPVIYCVLTVNNEQQALDRAGGAVGDKGTEAAMAAVSMAAIKREADKISPF